MKFLFENWRRFLTEQDEPKVVTFDFDDTLSLSHWGEEEDDWVHDGPNPIMIKRIKKFIADPSTTVYIVTSRFEKYEPQSLERPYQKAVQEFLDENNLNVDGIYFTNGKSKIETLLQLGSIIHHDDDPGDVLDSRANNIEAIVSDPYGDYGELEASELQVRKQKSGEELEEVGLLAVPASGTTSLNMNKQENEDLKDEPLT